jgi:hypothetical protein
MTTVPIKRKNVTRSPKKRTAKNVVNSITALEDAVKVLDAEDKIIVKDISELLMEAL